MKETGANSRHPYHFLAAIFSKVAKVGRVLGKALFWRGHKILPDVPNSLSGPSFFLSCLFKGVPWLMVREDLHMRYLSRFELCLQF